MTGHSGHKKRPLKEPVYRARVLSPDGYTILPMRRPTTRMIVDIVITMFVKGKTGLRQWVEAEETERRSTD
jgi:hypothetical protein